MSSLRTRETVCEANRDDENDSGDVSPTTPNKKPLLPSIASLADMSQLVSSEFAFFRREHVLRSPSPGPSPFLFNRALSPPKPEHVLPRLVPSSMPPPPSMPPPSSKLPSASPTQPRSVPVKSNPSQNGRSPAPSKSTPQPIPNKSSPGKLASIRNSPKFTPVGTPSTDDDSQTNAGTSKPGSSSPESTITFSPDARGVIHVDTDHGLTPLDLGLHADAALRESRDVETISEIIRMRPHDFTVEQSVGGVNGVYRVTALNGSKWIFKPEDEEGFEALDIDGAIVPANKSDFQLAASSDKSQIPNPGTRLSVNAFLPPRLRRISSGSSADDDEDGPSQPHSQAHSRSASPWTTPLMVANEGESPNQEDRLILSDNWTAATKQSMQVKVPLKKGIIYGETAKKEIAAYLLDHEGHAGVPTTVPMQVLVPSKSSSATTLLSTVLADRPHGGVPSDSDTDSKLSPKAASRPRILRRKSRSAKGSDDSDNDLIGKINSMKRSPLHRSQSGHTDLASAMRDEWNRSSRRNRRRSTEIAQSKLSEIKNRFRDDRSVYEFVNGLVPLEEDGEARKSKGKGKHPKPSGLAKRRSFSARRDSEDRGSPRIVEELPSIEESQGTILNTVRSSNSKPLRKKSRETPDKPTRHIVVDSPSGSAVLAPLTASPISESPAVSPSELVKPLARSNGAWKPRFMQKHAQDSGSSPSPTSPDSSAVSPPSPATTISPGPKIQEVSTPDASACKTDTPTKAEPWKPKFLRSKTTSSTSSNSSNSSNTTASSSPPSTVSTLNVGPASPPSPGSSSSSAASEPIRAWKPRFRSDPAMLDSPPEPASPPSDLHRNHRALSRLPNKPMLSVDPLSSPSNAPDYDSDGADNEQESSSGGSARGKTKPQPRQYDHLLEVDESDDPESHTPNKRKPLRRKKVTIVERESDTKVTEVTGSDSPKVGIRVPAMLRPKLGQHNHDSQSESEDIDVRQNSSDTDDTELRRPMALSRARSSPEIKMITSRRSVMESRPYASINEVKFTPTVEMEIKYGALQAYKEHFASAEDIGNSQFGVDEVHKIGILDIRLLNLDRHLGNLLVAKDECGAPRLIPIDHGYILPDFRNTSDVSFEWLHWKQCKAPFSPASKTYIDKLDAIADAIILKKLGIRDEHIMTLILSTTLLRLSAKRGLCLFDIACMIQRQGTKEDEALFERMTKEAGREADDLLRAHQTKLQRRGKRGVSVPESPMASPYFSTFFHEASTTEAKSEGDQSLVIFGTAAPAKGKTHSPKVRFTLFLEAFIKIAHREIDLVIKRLAK